MYSPRLVPNTTRMTPSVRGYDRRTNRKERFKIADAVVLNSVHDLRPTDVVIPKVEQHIQPDQVRYGHAQFCASQHAHPEAVGCFEHYIR